MTECKLLELLPEPEFVNLLRSPEIDSQPGGIDSWTPETYTKTGSDINGAKGLPFRWVDLFQHYKCS
jgi:hypothetical protein